MGTQMYLEQYLDSEKRIFLQFNSYLNLNYFILLKTDLENLSPELTRNFKLIYDLDSRVHELLKEIDTLKCDYLTNLKTMDTETRLAQMRLIEKKYEKCKELGDEKVQLANQTYEMVDKHIRRLDTDLARFEVELKQRMGHQKLNAASNAAAADAETNQELEQSSAVDSSSTTKRSKKKKNEQVAPIM